MMKNPFRRAPRVDPEVLDQQTDEINTVLEQTEERRNAIASYLEKRKDQNGFGRDFEYTLRPRRAS